MPKKEPVKPRSFWQDIRANFGKTRSLAEIREEQRERDAEKKAWNDHQRRLEDAARHENEPTKAAQPRAAQSRPQPPAQSRASSTKARAAAESATRCGDVSLLGRTLSWEVFEESRSSKLLTGGPQLKRGKAPAKWGKLGDRAREIDASTSASVNVSGQLTEQRHSTATRTAAGAVVAGPVGALVGLGSKKKEMHDTRRVYLAVESDEWAELFEFAGGFESDARRLAQAINGAARRLQKKV